ncbi:MAG: molybdenum cofactor guanylyltransferase [Pseudomonadales bacterium]|nr:molybdenum cofactor guanylyltransferase [Pseudomonadales bacterium]MBO6596293.1 molybdenum cofactor guanylyltransferase [Pseudomonadales bacterium]MBO6656626.1 molybdenum cofactor guanylyltransferase [Pseudomonadales bacterium]MBO6702904.1 molybdenum cofactor guanylyltransferase [Pseudomonadales bacterium]MBO6822773.1 molybdenum cofactor guanylyltransferase [Pseudomonadales bacterium]
MDAIDKTTAIVLAGGKGSRMNYQEKAWLIHRDKPLIMHVLDCITSQVSNTLISRNQLDERYESLPYACFKDSDNQFEGPLSGIVACLRGVKTEYTLVVPCDAPNLPGNLVTGLMEGIKDSDVCIAQDSERDQPLIMLARTDVLESINRYLSEGRRSVHGWLNRHDFARVRFPEHQLHNINEVAQLE